MLEPFHKDVTVSAQVTAYSSRKGSVTQLMAGAILPATSDQ
jgi:hypothetical protein